MNVLTDAILENNGAVRILIVILALFLLGAMLGYLIEVLFRRFFSVHKWVNPGFMKGPWLPMYGFGLVGMFFLCYLLVGSLPTSIVLYNPTGNLFGREGACGPAIGDLLVIVIMALMLIALEFFAGLVFVKGFKVRLWDYSNMKGNIMGIICPVFNVIWFAVAVIYYYALNPFVYQMFASMFDYFYGSGDAYQVAHVGLIFALGLVYGIFVIDLVTSINLFSKVEKIAKESGMIERYEKLREETRRAGDEAKKKFFEKLPDSIKKNFNKEEKDKKNKPVWLDKVYEATRSAIFIDPDHNPANDNYDEKGRPKKEE